MLTLDPLIWCEDAAATLSCLGCQLLGYSVHLECRSLKQIMGGKQSLSQEQIDEKTNYLFTNLPQKYINVGIDNSLLNFSRMDSNAVLNAYASQLLSEAEGTLPDFIEKVGTALSGFDAVPQAVGVGALVISIILQIAFIATKGSQSMEDSPVYMLRRIFAEEKASEVRDLMDEYVKRYKMHLRDDHLLLEDTMHLERSLSLQLTRLRNSMLVDGHMNSRALKQWANGAAFHAQMLIQMARLQKKDPQSFEAAKSAARSALHTYNYEISKLLNKYKEYKTSVFRLHAEYMCGGGGGGGGCGKVGCLFSDVDIKNTLHLTGFCYTHLNPHYYTDFIFSKHVQIIGLKSYFLDILERIDDHCNEERTFKFQT